MDLRYLLAGVVSGALGWAGTFVLPENSWLMDVYPGVVLATAFFWVHTPPPSAGLAARAGAMAALLAGCVGGWRLAIEVAVRLAQDLPYLWAGTAGGAAVAVACLLAWRLPRGRWAGFALITLAGLLGGALFQALDRTLHALGENLWVLVLLVEWQTLVMVSAGWVRRRYG